MLLASGLLTTSAFAKLILGFLHNKAMNCQPYLAREVFPLFYLSDCHVSECWVGQRVLEREESEIVISERDRKYVRQVPLSFKMPVGCLGAPAPPSPASREAPASLAEKMELMQQTLLIQIFRMESSTSLSCSTCSSFSRTCCQVDSGWQVTRRCHCCGCCRRRCRCR